MGELLRPRYFGTTELPVPEGDRDGPTVHAGDVDPVGRKADWTLTGMSATHRFLVPAVIQAAGLATNPVDLYWAEYGLPKQEAPFVLDLGWAAFAGLPPPEDRIVWACPIPHARGLVDFLARVQFGTAAAPQWDSLHQRMDVLDRKFLDTLTIEPVKPPTVPVELFGLTGPAGVYFWTPPKDPWTQGPRLMQRAAPDLKKPRRTPFGSTSSRGSGGSPPRR